MDRLVKRRSPKFVRPALITGLLTALLSSAPSLAHFPDAADRPVHVRPSLRSPGYYISSFRERYNRPTYIGGKIAYWIEPTSQEAMSWHRSVHRGYYANHAPRMEDRYFYPKPWEGIAVGARVPVSGAPKDEVSGDEKQKPTTKTSPEDELNDGGTVKSAPAIEILPTPNP